MTEHLYAFLVWIGWNCDNAFYPPIVAQSFWSSPLGLFCSFTLAATSTFRVLHRKSYAGFFDTIWHMLMAMVATSAFYIGLNGAAPQHLVKSMLVLMTIRGLYKCALLLRRTETE